MFLYAQNCEMFGRAAVRFRTLLLHSTIARLRKRYKKWREQTLHTRTYNQTDRQTDIAATPENKPLWKKHEQEKRERTRTREEEIYELEQINRAGLFAAAAAVVPTAVVAAPATAVPCQHH